MKHGFKKDAERIAEDMRRLVGVPMEAPLPARVLARKLEVPVLEPGEIPGLPQKITNQLSFNFERNWSGVTIPVDGENLIIYNPTHLPERQESDIMHELAHILCKHKPARIESAGFLPWKCRTFDKEQEDQAAWLGGCLQIPRCALLAVLKQKLDNDAIAAHFRASPEMVRFRRNMTAVDKILGNVVAPILERELGKKRPRPAPTRTSNILVQPELFA